VKKRISLAWWLTGSLQGMRGSSQQPWIRGSSPQLWMRGSSPQVWMRGSSKRSWMDDDICRWSWVAISFRCHLQASFSYHFLFG
jgi:hypothetical protein